MTTMLRVGSLITVYTLCVLWVAFGPTTQRYLRWIQSKQIYHQQFNKDLEKENI